MKAERNKEAVGRTEDVFTDYKPALSARAAKAEANRCLYCSDAPCIPACPTEINIPEFIRKIATDNVEGAARTIFSSNVLGMSCARVCPVETLCAGACVYNQMEAPPIQIGRLQRFATDEAFARDWKFFEAGPDTGKRVAIVGGGPAGLACAHRLRTFGHAVTIFEKSQRLGGLNASGVAPYKLRVVDADREVEWLMSIGGIDVQFGVDVPTDMSWKQLETKFDAIFVGVGLGADSWLDIAGSKLGGIVGAVDFIADLKLRAVSFESVRNAVVVGGGNTAIDVVRELLVLKSTGTTSLESVTLMYRGDEAAMSGYAHERSIAWQAGAKSLFRTVPLAFVGDGSVKSVLCASTDDQKRPIAGSERRIDADLVILAIGQQKIEIDLSGLSGVFVGGDFKNGGKEVVNAVAEGRDAAVAINDFLMKGGRRG